MGMSRRRFVKSVGAGLALTPVLMSGRSRAATAPARRLIIVNSIGTVTDAVWTPQSAPGQTPVLQPIHQPLKPYMNNILLCDGLTFVQEPQEGHTSPQTLTGQSYGTVFNGGTSVDQFISSRLGVQTRVPNLILGWVASGVSTFWSNGNQVAPIDSPINAWQTAFGSGAATSGSAPAMPRNAILNLVAKQVSRLQAGVGSEIKQRLQDHLDSVNQTISGMNIHPPSGCVAPTAPNIDPSQVENQSSSELILDAHASLIVSALACDVTRVISVQMGVSGGLPLLTNTVDEHTEVHSYTSSAQAQANLVACEVQQSTWFANLIAALQSTPDPLTPGSSLFDNTLLCWTRDISEAMQMHTQYSLPYVLAGGQGYLNTPAGGAYHAFGGFDITPSISGVPVRSTQHVVGKSHQRLLLNLCEYMGVTNFAAFGAVSALATAEQMPLQELKI